MISLSSTKQMPPPTTDLWPLAFNHRPLMHRRNALMEFTALKRLQAVLQHIETTMVRRENVIRFLVGRSLLMLAMVVGFWLAMRNSL